MEKPRLSRSIRRITVLRSDASGGTTPVVVYKKDSKKKKGSRVFKGAERVARRMVEAQEKTADRYLSRHRKSNEKKKNGWIRDFTVNTVRAHNRGVKALKLRRMFAF
jgi:hypothetical protein